jgi:signal transduction histidine kinase
VTPSTASPAALLPHPEREEGTVRSAALARWRAVHQDRWLTLFLLARGLAAAAAIGLLAAHRVTGHDEWLLVGAVIAGPGAMFLAAASRRLRTSPIAWSVDTLLALALVVASEDWRSPFYLLALSTLILPAVAVNLRASALWGASFVAAYFTVAAFTGLDSQTLDSTIRLETLATHLLVPVMVVLALSYSSDLLIRLRREEERARTLALEGERRRIAWELHDSAKQRVHAAHLVISAVREQTGGRSGAALDQGLRELQAATADMDTSVEELQSPLDGRRLDVALRARAEQLASATTARIEVYGEATELSPALVAHAYRIAAEALLNAIRHARASRIVVDISHRDGCLSVRVIDDGVGLPVRSRPGSHGMSFMRHRAVGIGARLHIGPGSGGQGTSVELDIPIDQEVSE